MTISELFSGITNADAYRETSATTASLQSTSVTPTLLIRDGEFVGSGVSERCFGSNLKVIVLGAAPSGSVSRVFFEGGYTPGQPTPPRCSSKDGIRPNYSNPLAQTCQDCKNYVWGSGPNGVGRACREYKTILILPTGCGCSTVYEMRVNGRSLTNLKAYAHELVENQIAVWKIITELSLSPGHNAVPVVIFSTTTLLDPLDFPAIQNYLDSPQVKSRLA